MLFEEAIGKRETGYFTGIDSKHQIEKRVLILDAFSPYRIG
jgi:hypothetical protein